jgi:NAD(P)-dependent dehydrogenase (short-subunit alcohol dehydrogenase family)
MTWERLEDLAGKVAVITGGAGAIGYATAVRLAQQQCRVALMVRSKVEEAEKMVKELPRQDLDHFVVVANITDTPSLLDAEKTVREQAGRCDILVNSAGISARGNPTYPMTDEAFDSIIINNLRGTYAVIRTFAALLRESGDGLIVNISSSSAQKAGPTNIAYAASKAGIDLMTQTLGRAYAPYKVRVVGVAPGFLENVVSGIVTIYNDVPTKMQGHADRVPLARNGIADDVASTIEALATHIRFATGTTILVDGGRIS